MPSLQINYYIQGGHLSGAAKSHVAVFLLYKCPGTTFSCNGIAQYEVKMTKKRSKIPVLDISRTIGHKGLDDSSKRP
mgnify:CR=1 FL=1